VSAASARKVQQDDTTNKQGQAAVSGIRHALAWRTAAIRTVGTPAGGPRAGM